MGRSKSIQKTEYINSLPPLCTPSSALDPHDEANCKTDRVVTPFPWLPTWFERRKGAFAIEQRGRVARKSESGPNLTRGSFHRVRAVDRSKGHFLVTAALSRIRPSRDDDHSATLRRPREPENFDRGHGAESIYLVSRPRPRRCDASGGQSGGRSFVEAFAALFARRAFN